VNSAYIRLAKEQAKRERRTDLMAAVLGWSFIVTGALIGAAMFYLFTFTVLSLGA
jgi:heme oxygenase